MHFLDKIEPKANVRIVARERGKRVPALCREDHNTWVNFGRQYLAEVISPLDLTFAKHYGESSAIRVVRYVAMGIGGAEQVVSVAATYPTLNTHYPGQNTYSDSNVAINYLERPMKVTGVPGVSNDPGVWGNSLSAPPDFVGTPVTRVDFVAFFSETDLHLGGTYPAVPLSECGLMLSDVTISRLSNQVYHYSSPPAYIGSLRQYVVAYNAFATLVKTAAVTLEIHWEISF